MDRLRFGPRHEPDKDKPAEDSGRLIIGRGFKKPEDATTSGADTGDTGRLRVSASLRPKPPETPAEDSGRLIIGRGFKKPETDASQEVTISPDEFEYPTFTQEQSRELISRNVSEIKRLIDLVGIDKLKDTLNGLNLDLNPNVLNVGFPSPTTGKDNKIVTKSARESLSTSKNEYRFPAFPTAAKNLPFEGMDKIWKENVMNRVKFYLSIKLSMSDKTDSFFLELYKECEKNKVTLQIKSEEHDYDQPCLYTAQPEELKKILVKLYKKYPDIWKETNRYLQGDLKNEVNPKHIAFVHEPYARFTLVHQTHSGRMEKIGEYLTKKIKLGAVLDEKLFTEAAIYAGVSPEEPHKLNPSYWRKFMKKTPEEVIDFDLGLDAEIKVIENYKDSEKFAALTPAEKFELINRTQALLKKLYDAGYKGIYVVVDLENLYETFLENYISKI